MPAGQTKSARRRECQWGSASFWKSLQGNSKVLTGEVEGPYGGHRKSLQGTRPVPTGNAACPLHVALAYVANEKRDEDCYPSDSYLAELTHFNNSAVRKSRNRLRANRIIDWISGGMSRQGGNVSNRYGFLFPHLKMMSKRERYQPMKDNPTLSPGVPTPLGGVPYATSERTLRLQVATNTERTLKKTEASGISVGQKSG